MSFHSMEETESILWRCWAHQPWNWSNLLSDRGSNWQKLCQEGKHSQCQLWSGRKWVKRDQTKGWSNLPTLSDPSSLLPTPCCHHFQLFAHQVTSPKFLAAHQSSIGFLSCGKSLLCHWPCQWVQPAKRSSLWRHSGVQRSEQSCPIQGVVIFYFYVKTEIFILLFECWSCCFRERSSYQD